MNNRIHLERISKSLGRGPKFVNGSSSRIRTRTSPPVGPLWNGNFSGWGVRQIKLERVAEKLNFAKPDELFATIGHGALTTAQVIARIPELLSTAPTHGDSLPVIRKPKPVDVGKGGDVQIRGVGRLMTQMAHCCQPAPFEPIASYITRLP